MSTETEKAGEAVFAAPLASGLDAVGQNLPYPAPGGEGHAVTVAGEAHSRNGERLLRSVLVVLVTVALLAAYRNHVWRNPQQPYQAPLFVAGETFSLDRFREVHTGMTAAEVREIIGNPCQRYSADPSGPTVWRYTFPSTVRKTPYLHCSLTFDGHDGKVVRVTERKTTAALIHHPLAQLNPRPAGQVVLKGGLQPEKLLEPNASAPRLLLVTSNDDALVRRNTEEILQRVDELRGKGFEIYLISPTAARDLPGAYAAVQPALDWAQGLPDIGWPYALVVYHRGELYRGVPAAHRYFPEETRADEEWLTAQLLKGE